MAANSGRPIDPFSVVGQRENDAVAFFFLSVDGILLSVTVTGYVVSSIKVWLDMGGFSKDFERPNSGAESSNLNSAALAVT